MSQVAPGLVAPIVAGLDRLLIAKMGQDFVYEVLLLNAPVRRIGDDSDRSPQRPVPGELRCPLAGGVEQASFGACYKVKSSNLRKSKSFPTIRVENREKLMKTRPKLWQNCRKCGELKLKKNNKNIKIRQLEAVAFNQLVAGSNPARPTNFPVLYQVLGALPR
jgi:hypothetical protein